MAMLEGLLRYKSLLFEVLSHNHHNYLLEIHYLTIFLLKQCCIIECISNLFGNGWV